MNDSRKPCDNREQEISLLAAGCLTALEERELRQHLAMCDGCREQFAELASLSASLRAAKPAMDADSVRDLTRSLGYARSPASMARPRRSAARRNAMLATAVLVFAGILSHFALRPKEHMERPDVVQESPQAALKESDVPLPTLFALRDAAEESDESLDRLLARYSRPLLTQPLYPHALSQESAQ